MVTIFARQYRLHGAPLVADHAGSHGAVGARIDQHERAGRVVALV